MPSRPRGKFWNLLGELNGYITSCETLCLITYCEDHTPSPHNQDKEHYSGLFTTKEVQEVSAFLCLLLVLMTLFKYHVASQQSLILVEHMQL